MKDDLIFNFSKIDNYFNSSNSKLANLNLNYKNITMAETKKQKQEMDLKFTRDDYVLLCDLAMQSERYEEMIGFIKKFADGE